MVDSPPFAGVDWTASGRAAESRAPQEHTPVRVAQVILSSFPHLPHRTPDMPDMPDMPDEPA
jgi:hypothetical protein